MYDFHNPEHASVAQRALDRDRLLAGENPKSAVIEDPVHWSGVYADLIEFKGRLLKLMQDSHYWETRARELGLARPQASR